MQSGIEVSADLKSAFSSLLSSPSQFALTVSIENESLVPAESIASQSGFPSDLSLLTPKLLPNRALYLLIRTSSSGPQPLICMTYTPDAAPVRQKMLFASTQLTLLRQLGTEHFSENIFCTVADEVSPGGWSAHVAHSRLDNPLTAEEGERARLAEDEAMGGLSGTTGRRELANYDQARGGAAAAAAGGNNVGGAPELAIEAGEGVLSALESVRDCGPGALAVLKLDERGAALQVEFSSAGDGAVGADEVAGRLHASNSPRFGFYSLATPEAQGKKRLLFMYTCPNGSKVKERMVYASSRNHVVKLAEAQAGLRLDRKLEGSGPEDFSSEALLGEFREAVEEKKGFARPKRPGRR